MNKSLTFILLFSSGFINFMLISFELDISSFIKQFSLGGILETLISGLFLFSITYIITSRRTQKLIDIEKEHNRERIIDERKTKMIFPIYEKLSNDILDSIVFAISPTPEVITIIPEKLQGMYTSLLRKLFLLQDVLSNEDYVFVTTKIVAGILNEAKEKFLIEKNGAYHLKDISLMPEYKKFCSKNSKDVSKNLKEIKKIIKTYVL